MATKKKPKFSHAPTEQEYSDAGWVRLNLRLPPEEVEHVDRLAASGEARGKTIRRVLAAAKPAKK